MTVSGESAPSLEKGAEIQKRVRSAEPAWGRDVMGGPGIVSSLTCWVTLGSSLPLTEPQGRVCVLCKCGGGRDKPLQFLAAPPFQVHSSLHAHHLSGLQEPLGGGPGGLFRQGIVSICPSVSRGLPEGRVGLSQPS